MNLSFAGCGFMGIYHVGVAACLRKYAPHLLLERISGASAGAMAAACLLCDVPLDFITKDVLEIASMARSKILGPFSPSLNVDEHVRSTMRRVLPEDAAQRCNGKLHISVTCVYTSENVILKDFVSKEEIIDAICCSAFIPGFSGIIPPKFRGVRYMDGGFTDNLVLLDEHTMTVSPFCGESDICPRDGESSNAFHVILANTSIEFSRKNIIRMAHIMFPPAAETLSKICQQGFDDARKFLHTRNLVACGRCLSSSASSFSSYARSSSCRLNILSKQSSCTDCESQLQSAIETANRGFFNWAFKHKTMKVLSILSIPYVLPADMALAAFNKFLAQAPGVGASVKGVTGFVRGFISSTMGSIGKKTEELTCKLSISQFIESELDVCEPNNNTVAEGKEFVSQASLSSLKTLLDLGFTINVDEKTGSPSTNIIESTLYPNAGYFGDSSFEQLIEESNLNDLIVSVYYDDQLVDGQVFHVDETDFGQCSVTLQRNNPVPCMDPSKDILSAWDDIPDPKPIIFRCQGVNKV
ncbi:hypothetical protein QYM36_011308 [Artemia franciscana]|uniref:triacylglycerol lipase n=1 Tax=Artemia franciscana TaxID=6661 RepID=A0AA88L4H1_ARTSF|nr:hypothetical protein QYM36_011308 [Artemia franciscana]